MNREGNDRIHWDCAGSNPSDIIEFVNRPWPKLGCAPAQNGRGTAWRLSPEFQEKVRAFRRHLHDTMWIGSWPVHGGGRHVLSGMGSTRCDLGKECCLGYLHNYREVSDQFIARRIAIRESSDVFVRLAPEQPFMRGTTTLQYDDVRARVGDQGIAYRFITLNRAKTLAEQFALAALNFERWCIIIGERMEAGTSAEFLVETVEPIIYKYYDGHKMDEHECMVNCFRNVVIGRPATVPPEWFKQQKRRRNGAWPFEKASKDENGMYMDAGIQSPTRMGPPVTARSVRYKSAK